MNSDPEPTLNIVQKFYQWLFPAVLFEFLKRQSPESFAASITVESDKRPVWGTGSYNGKFNVEITPDMAGGYDFSVRRNVMSYLTAVATGTIRPVNREMVQIQGKVVTKPRAIAFVFFLPLLIIPIIWGSLLTSSFHDLNVFVGVALIIAFFIVIMVLNLRAWKAMMTLYSDGLVGTLARLAKPD